MLTSAAGDIGYKLYKILNGSIIVLALLTVLEGAALTEWGAMATIFVTLGANAIAEAFSRGLANEIANKRQATFPEAITLLRRSLSVVIPGIVPAVAFIAVAAGWLPLGKAFIGACWFLVFVLFAAGYAACVIGGGKVWRGLLYGAIISAFGLGIVALRLMSY